MTQFDHNSSLYISLESAICFPNQLSHQKLTKIYETPPANQDSLQTAQLHLVDVCNQDSLHLFLYAHKVIKRSLLMCFCIFLTKSTASSWSIVTFSTAINASWCNFENVRKLWSKYAASRWSFILLNVYPGNWKNKKDKKFLYFISV